MISPPFTPAEKAGVKGGDIIVELSGKPVQNIYDFMHAMKDLSIGKPAPLVVLRDGKRVKLEIVPASRE